MCHIDIQITLCSSLFSAGLAHFRKPGPEPFFRLIFVLFQNICKVFHFETE